MFLKEINYSRAPLNDGAEKMVLVPPSQSSHPPSRMADLRCNCASCAFMKRAKAPRGLRNCGLSPDDGLFFLGLEARI